MKHFRDQMRPVTHRGSSYALGQSDILEPAFVPSVLRYRLTWALSSWDVLGRTNSLCLIWSRRRRAGMYLKSCSSRRLYQHTTSSSSNNMAHNKSSDTIALPKHYTAYIFGAATSGVVQEILVQVQDTNSKELGECTFKGLNEPLAVRGGVAFQDTEAVVITADNNNARQLKINFKAGPGNPAYGFKKDKQDPFSWVTNYTYCTEDSPSGGNDYHDTTLVVSLIKNNK
ncbi:hypothetical protein M405DRAFT_936865 [Rhizopogon salebrosus TDB-379]|nr:hypothetical protein M405DRAFT_936865 [Rhizopogon salebrosus TDB-379]